MSLQESPVSGGRAALLAGGLAVLLVGVFAAGGLLARKTEPAEAQAAAPTTPSTTAAPRAPSAKAVPTVPAVTPSRNPRRQPDVDRGTPIDHGVFVEIAADWKKVSSFAYGLDLASWDRGAGASFFVRTRPMPSLPLMRQDAEGFAADQQLYGFQAGRARVLPVPNRNIVEAASITFTGRRRMDDLTYSLGGECVRLRGAPETNDVSLSVCWAAYVQDLDTVRPQIQRMIASAARSI
jgi:hypothetical protein